MTLSKKISLGYGLICFVLLSCSVAGYFGVHSLSYYLAYLTGPAWDTADSCMESSIEIQAQIIATKQLADGIDTEANLQRYNDANVAADECMLRLKAAGLLPSDRVDALLEKYQVFKQVRDKYVASFAEEQAAHEQYQLAKKNCLQHLEKNHEGNAEGNAAQLKGELLGQLLLVEQMKSVENFESSAQQLTAARVKFSQEYAASLQHPSLSAVYQSLTTAIDSYQQVLMSQHVALGKFEQYTGEFLDFVAVLEDEADGTVENTKAVLAPAAIRRATWSLIAATLIGLCVGVIAAVVITRSVVGAIRKVVTFSHKIASGNLDQRLHLTSKDEMAEMADSLNIAVENTAHTLATIQKTNERQTTAVDEILIVLHKVAKGDYSQNITVSGDDAIGRLAAGMQEFIADKQQAELAADEMNEREKLHQTQRLEEDRKRAHQEKERLAQELLRTQVNQLLEVVTAAAAGDLTKDVPFTGSDAMGELAQGLQRMIEDLRGITREISEGTAQFTEGSKVIAETCQNFAHNAQQQLDGVEHISTTLEQLASSVQHVVQRVAHANALASESARLAETGGQTVHESMQAMELIKGSSSQIGEIVQVIADIARQTNMLALNAAIEAARAGEHGLGFAVVADEVRKLAERTNSATGEISQLVRDAMLRVDDGVLRSSATSDSLRSILAGVDATAKEIAQIAITTQAQSQNAQQIKASVESIRLVTEQNATISGELASNSEVLNSQSQVMRDIVSHFKTSTQLAGPQLPARDRFRHEPTKSPAV